MHHLLSITVSFAMLALVACNPYNPNLGANPFRCAPEGDGQRCPEGYECTSMGPDDEVCARVQTGPDASLFDSGIDARNFDCANDSEIEPNDSINDATDTPIPEFANEYRLVSLAICPDTDQDFFEFDIDTIGKDVLVEVDYQSDRGQLLVDVLNATGVSIREATPTEDDAGMPDPNRLRAEIFDQAVGTYYVHVRAPVGTTNNYSVGITVTGP